jgi:hypothetical protein
LIPRVSATLPIESTTIFGYCKISLVLKGWLADTMDGAEMRQKGYRHKLCAINGLQRHAIAVGSCSTVVQRSAA